MPILFTNTKLPDSFDFITEYFAVKFTDKTYNNNDINCFTAVEDNVIVGVVIYRKKKDIIVSNSIHDNIYNSIHITFIRVLEGHSKSGIGSILVHLVEQEAKNLNINKTTTKVFVKNIKSINFFSKLSYKISNFVLNTSSKTFSNTSTSIPENDINLNFNFKPYYFFEKILQKN